MEGSKGKVHVCLLPEQVRLLEAFGKSKGFLTLSQTLEHILSEKYQ